MATIPSLPATFATGEVPTVAKMNQLGTAVAWATGVPIAVSLKRSSTQSISAAGSVAVQWNVSELDNDGMHSNSTNPSRLTCQTQGYYFFTATLAMTETSTASYTSARFQQTTGANNPLGSGQSQIFGPGSFYSGATSSDFRSINMACLSPCLYVGDYVEVYVYSTVACTLQWNWLATGHADSNGAADGASCLYGYYVCEGP